MAIEVELQQMLTETEQKIYNELEQYLTNITAPKTTKQNNTDGMMTVAPLCPIDIARYLYHKSSELRKTINTYAKDTLLNHFTLQDTNATEQEITLFNHVWNNNYNKTQLYYTGIENLLYGYGAMEITGTGKHTRFNQIPAHTLTLKTRTFTDDQGKQYQFFYACQTVNGTETYLRLAHLDYSMLDKSHTHDESEGYCIWFGGCNENDFFDLPLWETCVDDIFTCIAIQHMTKNKMETGNQAAGVLMFQGPPQLLDPDDPNDIRVDEKLERDLDGANGGTMFCYLENNSSTRDITMQYQALTDNNYDYFKLVRDDAEKKIMSVYMVPEPRLMRLDTKESMNSDKTEKVFEIYCNQEIPTSQMQYEERIRDYCKYYLGFEYPIVMGSPNFVDKTKAHIDNIALLFDKGLISLGKATELLGEVYPELDLQSELDHPELYNMRFYNGHILGSNDTEQKGYDQAIDEIMQYIN